MARRTQVLPSEPPTLTPQRAIELIRRQLDKYPEIVKLHRDDPEVQKWESTTEGILNAAFGKPNGQHHANTEAFMYTIGVTYMGGKRCVLRSRTPGIGGQEESSVGVVDLNSWRSLRRQ
jgi:hypothetical protein